MADCKAVLAIGNERFRCDVAAPHRGRAHRNDDASAHWCSDGEARAAEREEASSDR